MTTRPGALERTSSSTRIGARRWRLGPACLSIGLYAAIGVVAFWHAWVSGPSQYALSGGGDQAASMWFLTWAPYSLLHGHNPLFSAYGNYPYGVNLMANTSTLPLGLLVSPVTLLFGPVVSFNLVGTLAFVLSAGAAYALLCRFTTWRPAAFAGGLLYGFSPYMVAQGIGHMNLVFVPLPPLILLLMHDVVVRQRGRPVLRGTALGLLAVVQFFLSSEVLLGTLVIGAAGVLVGALLARREVHLRLRYAATALVTAAGIAVALLAYPVWFLFDGPAHIVGPIQAFPQAYRADLLGTVLPDSLMHFSPATFARTADQFAGNATENGSYLGLPLVVLVVVGVVALWRVRVVRVAGILCAFAFVLSLGSRLVVHNHVTGVVLPEAIFDKLPLFKNVVPVRFSLYVTLCAAVVLAVVLERVRMAHLWRRPGAALAVPAVLSVAVLLPVLPAWPYHMEQVSVPAYFTSGAANAIPQGSVVLVYPFPDAGFANPESWQASTYLRFEMPGGRFIVPRPGTRTQSSSRPSLTDDVLSALAAGDAPARTPTLRARVDAQLHSWRVRTVVAVPEGTDPQQAQAYLTWLLGRPPTVSDGALTWYDWS
ncbi:MAG TPA: hypothetical protein VMR97_12030 [Acidimicrobiales bacterium]|nr:hypothetical protein [Acidimicrobiales bacterium]